VNFVHITDAANQVVTMLGISVKQQQSTPFCKIYHEEGCKSGTVHTTGEFVYKGNYVNLITAIDTYLT
jgi:hypothetical protein